MSARIPSVFVRNCSLAAAGSLVGWLDDDAHDLVATMAQGDASRLFLSVGESVERRTGSSRIAASAMDTLATIIGLLFLAATVAGSTASKLTIDQLSDLVGYFAERIKHAGLTVPQ